MKWPKRQKQTKRQKITKRTKMRSDICSRWPKKLASQHILENSGSAFFGTHSTKESFIFYSLMDFVWKRSVETLPQHISIFGGLNTSYDGNAIQAAGLVDTLAGPGPFTVFAPTNLAFDKIPKEALAGLLEDKDALTSVLLRHVVPAKLMGKVWCDTVDWWCENLQYILKSTNHLNPVNNI